MSFVLETHSNTVTQIFTLKHTHKHISKLISVVSNGYFLMLCINLKNQHTGDHQTSNM